MCGAVDPAGKSANRGPSRVGEGTAEGIGPESTRNGCTSWCRPPRPPERCWCPPTRTGQVAPRDRKARPDNQGHQAQPSGPQSSRHSPRRPDCLGHVLLLDLIDPRQIGDGPRHPTHPIRSPGGEHGVADGRRNQRSCRGGLKQRGSRWQVTVHLSARNLDCPRRAVPVLPPQSWALRPHLSTHSPPPGRRAR